MYKLPQFNLTVDIWKTSPTTYLKTTIRQAGVKAQMYGLPSYPSATFRLPKGTQVLQQTYVPTYYNGDLIIATAMPNTYWYCYTYVPVHVGFPNEYWIAICNYDPYNSTLPLF